MTAPKTPAAICGPECWTEAKCPDHGHGMNPKGRDAGLSDYQCCENYATRINKRHLWDEHDSTRIYNDPVGWAEHEASCARCRGDDDD